MRFAWIVLLAGCSFVFVSGPPASAPPNADCTESRVAPIADVVLTSALLAGGIAGVSAKNNCQPMSDIDCLGSGLGVAFANVAGVIGNDGQTRHKKICCAADDECGVEQPNPSSGPWPSPFCKHKPVVCTYTEEFRGKG